MPEIIFNGPAGYLEGRYQPSLNPTSPIVLFLHPHPKFGGNMKNKIIYDLFYLFQRHGFTCLRFNFRGRGKSQGEFDHGVGELADAAAALDWIQLNQPASNNFWVVGYSFGAWIAMQLLMRRPEIDGFITIGLQPNLYDFSFLAPCPSSGLIVHGSEDKVSPLKKVQPLIDRLKAQRGITITQSIIEGADHFFKDHEEELLAACSEYIDMRLNGTLSVPALQHISR